MSSSIFKHRFLIDLFFNTLSLVIYIASQQLFLMPIMSKTLSESSFALFIMYNSIFSIISNSLGSELGIVRQIYNQKKESDDYNYILTYLLIFVFVVSFVCVLVLGYDYFDTFMLCFVIILANVRLYIGAYFRMFRKFSFVLIQNLLYMLGIIIGVALFNFFPLVWLPCIFAELLSFLFSYNNSDVKFIIQVHIKKINRNIITSFKNYSLIEFLINMMTYFDKILIYPVLGVTSVNIYYATSTMSKMVSLITNPMHGVLLSWINNDDKKKRNNIVSLCLKYCFPIIIIVSIISIPLTYFAVKFFYNQYLEQSIMIIIPIGIGVGFSFASSIIKAFLLKFIESRALLKTYVYYLICFVILSLLLSNLYGLLGFAYANMFSNIILIILFFNQLLKLKSKEVINL